MGEIKPLLAVWHSHPYGYLPDYSELRQFRCRDEFEEAINRAKFKPDKAMLIDKASFAIVAHWDSRTGFTDMH